jgi:hypothetical protein
VSLDIDSKPDIRVYEQGFPQWVFPDPGTVHRGDAAKRTHDDIRVKSVHKKRESWLNAGKYRMMSGCAQSIPED